MATKVLKIRFSYLKDTINTWRYQEDGPKPTQKIGSIYIKQGAFDIKPDALEVTITPITVIPAN